MYEQDDAGRLLRSTPEAEWDDLQQGWMVALGLYDATRCNGCGGDLQETTTHDRWIPQPPLECHRCSAISQQQKQYAQDYPDTMHSFRWFAKRGR